MFCLASEKIWKSDIHMHGFSDKIFRPVGIFLLV